MTHFTMNESMEINKAWQECLAEARKELPNMAGIISSEQAQLAAEKYAVRFGKYLRYNNTEKLHQRFIEEENNK